MHRFPSVLSPLLVAMGLVLGLTMPASAAETLKDAFGPAFAIGTAIQPPALVTAGERQILARHFSAVTAENGMKPDATQPTEGHFDFAVADATVALAIENHQDINGHALVWHSQCPDWFFTHQGQPATREMLLQRMRTHIATVAGRYAGRLASWDVVNEAIDEGPGYLRPSPWLKIIGPEFVHEAFVAARAADPTAELYYNDFSIEFPEKRAKTLRLVRELKARQTPLQGIGIQGHWQLDKVPFDHIEASILAFHAEGLRVAFTEVDIDVSPRSSATSDVNHRETAGEDPYVHGLPEPLQQRLADQYRRLFALFLKHRDKVSRVTIWGIHDGVSWLNYWPRPRTNHPLLWDRDLKPKPALQALLGLGSP